MGSGERCPQEKGRAESRVRCAYVCLSGLVTYSVTEIVLRSTFQRVVARLYIHTAEESGIKGRTCNTYSAHARPKIYGLLWLFGLLRNTCTDIRAARGSGMFCWVKPLHGDHQPPTIVPDLGHGRSVVTPVPASAGSGWPKARNDGRAKQGFMEKSVHVPISGPSG